MQKKTITIAALLLLALAVGACAPVAASSQAEPRTLSVNGTGTVTLSPDMAHIYIGVSTEDEDAAQAVADNNGRVEDVMASLEGFGIPPEDIQTTNFSIYSQTQWGPDGEDIGTLYVVQNTVLVTVRDLETLGELLDAVVSSGANAISGIQFDVADRESVFTQALEAAMQNAESRAATLAEAAGVSLGAVNSVSSYLYGGGFEQPVMGLGGGADFAEAAARVPVSAGEMEITVEVNVIYEID